jgi:hypothetical protein
MLNAVHRKEEKRKKGKKSKKIPLLNKAGAAKDNR